MDELSEDLEAHITKKKELMVKKKSFDDKIADLTEERSKVWKELREINQYLMRNCDHVWRREAYFYSPLYCSLCGYERA